MLLAVCQEFGIETENEAIPHIALGFAGGIGITGDVCGAVAGAVMAISLKLGKAEAMEDKLRSFSVIRAFRQRFEKEMGSIICTELTGLDMTAVDLSMEGFANMMTTSTPEKVCFPAVATAYDLVVDLLQDPD